MPRSGRPEGRPERTSRPFCVSRKSRACHAKGRSPGGTPEASPERTSRPFCVSKKSRDFLPLQKARDVRKGRPKGRPERTSRPFCVSRKSRDFLPRKGRDVRFGVPLESQVGSAPFEWQAPERTSRPLQSRKSRACHAKGAEPRWDARGTPERTSRPLQSRKSRACHAKGRSPGGTPEGRQSVHHAPCRAESRAPATQKDMCE